MVNCGVGPRKGAARGRSTDRVSDCLAWSGTGAWRDSGNTGRGVAERRAPSDTLLLYVYLMFNLICHLCKICKSYYRLDKCEIKKKTEFKDFFCHCLLRFFKKCFSKTELKSCIKNIYKIFLKIIAYFNSFCSLFSRFTSC